MGQSAQSAPNPSSVAQPGPNDAIQNTGFNTMDPLPGDFPVDFGANDSDLLDNFDFDSFLNTTEDNGSGLGFGGDSLQWNDPGEIGADNS